MQEAQQQKVLLHDLARALIFDKTASEKLSNQKAQELLTINEQQETLIDTVYARIAQKKPHLLAKLNYLGKTNQPAITENSEPLSPALLDEDTASQNDSKLLQDEIVTTQLSQVAYHLRQKKRAFDKACLLELLGKDFMGRKSCLLTSRDLSKSCSDELRPKVFEMTQNSKMLQLLLALSQDPSGEQPPSTFAKNYLSRKMRYNEDQALFIKPHLADYLQNDCKLIERDKTSSGRQAYLNYDTSSFENPLFKKLQVADLSKTGPKPYTMDSLEDASVNRFNYDLLKQTQPNFQVDKEANYQVGLSASGGQEPAPLLGATLRSLDQAGSVIDKSKVNNGRLGGLFGAGENTGGRTFGMTLQIPSLPPIDQATIFHEDGSIDTKQVQPTFSFFQPSSSEEALQSGGQQTEEPVAKQPKGRLTITAQTSSGSSNKRHQKQNDKKHKKKQKVSVWSLMAYVDESVLDNNIAKESGIARLWEDESLHIHLRNLSVSEPGVITLQKEESFKACFKASVAGVIRVPDSSKTIKEKDLVRSLILVLQGIPSKQVFELDKTTFTFNTNPNLVIGDMCCNSESLQQLCQEFTQAGCYFLHLREFSEFMCSHKSTGAGQVVEAFALAIQEFLIFYQHQVNELDRKAKAHRDTLDTSDSRSNLTDKFVSLLEIKVLMGPLLTQIESIASICFTSKFIEDIHLQKQEANNEADQSVDAANNDFAFVSLLYQRNALTSANLKEQIEENLERIRSQAWLNQFPRGARLLTYLYRIMIASEADLQVIELLRKVFAQAVRPILLMVSEFITIGSFKDPFDEFFVEKLYRNNNNKGGEQKQQSSDQNQAPVNEDDFIYKFTSDKTKVPVFLAANDSALMIFKIGCDLNLLKTKRQQILTDSQHQSHILVLDSKASNTRVNLPDYFAICATGDESTQRNNNCSMIEQASRELKLEFSMQCLQDNQNREQLLYEKQSEMLQAIESQIAKEETNALLEQILQREKASVFRQTEREKQIQLQAEARQNQKRQYMQVIEDNIAQRKKNRELKDKVDQAEKDRVRQEQLEYERIKKEVAENLKQQLMEILKENQTLADTRTEDAIQKEALERQVSELEARAEQAKQEVVVEDEILTPSITPTKSDQEMKDEGQMLQSDASKQIKSDESMLVDSVPSVKQEPSIEAAGKKSTVKDGGLAGLVFGQGAEAQSNSSSDEKMRIDSGNTDSPDSIKRDDDENQATVKVDDIQLELAGDEKQSTPTKIEQTNPEQQTLIVHQPEETSLEKKSFIESVFIKPLINRVFKFINEKQQIDSKRKTWNLKHQVSQIAALQRKKTDWEYHSVQKTSLKNRMDAIFREFQDVDGCQEQQEKIETQDESKDNMFNVPVTLAIEQSIISIVQNQHKLVNKCLLHMMHRGMFLLRHLEYLKMVLLASQGDVFFSLHEAVFNDDFQQTAKDSSLQFLNMQLEHAIRSSRPERNYSRTKNQKANPTRQVELGVNLTQLISEDGTELTKFKFVASGKSNQMKSNPNFFFTISNIGEYVRLDYSIEHPLDRVISQQCMNKYNTLFFFLLKLKRVNYCLTLIWKELNGVEFRRISPSDFKELRKLQFLWQQMQYFLRTIDEYVMVAVVQSQWSLLKQQLAQINYFEELISLHNAYLDTILEKCFLARARDNRLQITLNQIFDFVFKLHFLVRNYGVGVCRDQQARQDLQNISNSFRDYSRFMYQIVRNLSHKGQFKELFVRLDFNKFYQNTTINASSQAASGFTRNVNK